MLCYAHHTPTFQALANYSSSLRGIEEMRSVHTTQQHKDSALEYYRLEMTRLTRRRSLLMADKGSQKWRQQLFSAISLSSLAVDSCSGTLMTFVPVFACVGIARFVVSLIFFCFCHLSSPACLDFCHSHKYVDGV